MPELEPPATEAVLNPACTVATTVADDLAAGRISRVVAVLHPSMHDDDASIGDELAVVWNGTVDALGGLVAIHPPVCGPTTAGGQIVTTLIDCNQASFRLRLTVDPSGLITTLHLQPAPPSADHTSWAAPPYADPAAFTEHDLSVGPDELAVSATLCLPTSASRPVPAVVLIAGSGPSDRDSTVGPNKPLKDLAWGLASRGVATLRYDKVTYTHPDKIAADPDFTAADEYVPHAHAALDLLAHHPAIDSNRLFILGHSQGATMAPRVAERAHAPLAGLIMMAASAEPLHHAAVRQARYLAALDPTKNPDTDPGIATLTQHTALVDSDQLSPTTPPEDLPFGVPAAYWLDLRTYDAPATLSTVRQPILLMQGDRDYQVLSADLPLWTTALTHHPNLTVRRYPDDDHYFFTGSGPSTPASYLTPQHVDPSVISDIDAWISGDRPRS